MQRTISETTPPVPRVPSVLARRFWGLIHKALSRFSEHYCSWFGIPFNAHIVELPFGLIIKWTDRTSIEESIAMQMARAAGMPVPKLLCVGEHPGQNYNRIISILMTRLPGIDLVNSSDPLDLDAEGPWVYELKKCVHSMRLWQPTFGRKRICSAIGTSIRSSRVPNHIMGPFANEKEFHDFLLGPASRHGFKSEKAYQEALTRANKIYERPHRIVFTHGDFKAHNILVDDDGHLSGFLDWESAGWCPEYWDFATAMRFGRNSWWYQLASWVGGDQYMEELDSDIALNLLTVDSYIGF